MNSLRPTVVHFACDSGVVCYLFDKIQVNFLHKISFDEFHIKHFSAQSFSCSHRLFISCKVDWAFGMKCWRYWNSYLISIIWTPTMWCNVKLMNSWWFGMNPSDGSDIAEKFCEICRMSFESFPPLLTKAYATRITGVVNFIFTTALSFCMKALETSKLCLHDFHQLLKAFVWQIECGFFCFVFFLSILGSTPYKSN